MSSRSGFSLMNKRRLEDEKNKEEYADDRENVAVYLWQFLLTIQKDSCPDILCPKPNTEHQTQQSGNCCQVTGSKTLNQLNWTADKDGTTNDNEKSEKKSE